MSSRLTISNPLAATWPLAVTAAANLTRPRADVDASDAVFEALLLDSALARWAAVVVRAVGRSWAHSRAREVVGRATVEARRLSTEQAVRAASGAVAVASTSAMLLGAIRPAPIGPLAWVLPGFLAAASVAMLAAAGPLAGTLGDRRP